MTVTSQCAAASVSTERWLTKVYVTLVTWTPLGLPDGGTSVSGAPSTSSHSVGERCFKDSLKLSRYNPYFIVCFDN